REDGVGEEHDPLEPAFVMRVRRHARVGHRRGPRTRYRTTGVSTPLSVASTRRPNENGGSTPPCSARVSARTASRTARVATTSPAWAWPATREARLTVVP